MADSKKDKTNVMRILDSRGVGYAHYSYDNTVLNAEEVADAVGAERKSLFKTLVTKGRSGEHYVFMVPCEEELDLKAAAAAAGEKGIEMIPQKELLPLTGYIHGGCSPIGMKKAFATFIDSSALGCEKIFFSGGKPGRQVCVAVNDLLCNFDIRPRDIARKRSAP